MAIFRETEILVSVFKNTSTSESSTIQVSVFSEWTFSLCLTAQDNVFQNDESKDPESAHHTAWPKTTLNVGFKPSLMEFYSPGNKQNKLNLKVLILLKILTVFRQKFSFTLLTIKKMPKIEFLL